MTSQDIAVRAPKGRKVSKPAARDPSDLMTALVSTISNPDFDIEKLRQLREIYNEEVADRRRLEFNAAMAECQKAIPVIKANKRNPDTESWYASLDQMAKVITPIYTQYGFSVSFGMFQSTLENCYGITAKVAHRGGHSESFNADVPIDNAGKQGTVNKTRVHAFGSTLSYAQRYMVKLIFNVSIEGEDKDGNKPGSTITPEQVVELRKILSDNKIEEGPFLAIGKLSKLEDMPARHFDRARANLLQRVAAQKAPAK